MTEDSNPYESPKSTMDHPALDPAEIVPASTWLRVFNLVIDYVAFLALSVVIGVIVALVFGERGIEAVESMPNFLLGVIILLLYYIPSESLTQRTIGKLVTGTKVVDENGMKPTFRQILGRSFSRLIPFEFFSFFGENARGWHDSIPKTYVIKCR